MNEQLMLIYEVLVDFDNRNVAMVQALDFGMLVQVKSCAFAFLSLHMLVQHH